MKNNYLIAFGVIILLIFGAYYQIYTIKKNQEVILDAISPVYGTVDPVKIEALQRAEQDLTPLVKEVAPSVVSILTDAGSGTGLVVDENLVITNWHVLEWARRVTIIDSEGESYKVELVGYDRWRDLALVEIDGKLPSLNLADSEDVKIGQRVISVGDPFGLEGSVSEGIVSNLRDMGDGLFIQHSVPINQGNSGGPLINMNGEVIGINTFKIIEGEGLGFAIPSNEVKEFIKEVS